MFWSWQPVGPLHATITSSTHTLQAVGPPATSTGSASVGTGVSSGTSRASELPDLIVVMLAGMRDTSEESLRANPRTADDLD
jgi:hypothetical protein